mgnify:CR=1 FL=1
MARYRKIDVRIWSDAKFCSLSAAQPNAQTLWLYLLTNPETTSIPGLFRSGEMMMAEALGWSLEGFREAFREASSKGLVKADWKARLVWIPNAIKHNPPESPNVVRGWRTAWDELPECSLKVEAFQALEALLKGFTEGFQKAFREACPKPMANQEQEQEQEQEKKILPASPAAEAPESASPEKPSDPRHHATIAVFKAAFEAAHGGAFWKPSGADVKQLKTMLTFPDATQDEIAKRIAFAFEDAFFRKSGTLALFASKWPTWTPTTPKWTKGRAPVEQVNWEDKTTW